MSRYWLRLDNAALIFPAIRKKGWSNAFRISVTLTEDIDPAVLQQAVCDLMPRFPSMYVRLRSGVFWHYLEEIKDAPKVSPDYAYPLTHMAHSDLKNCCLRVLYHKNRIAAEFFHSLTDGTGGSVYLKSLAARYIELKYGETVCGNGILSAEDSPSALELEDSFLKYSAKKAMSRSEKTAYRLKGTKDKDFLHLITGTVHTSSLLDTAHKYGCTVTVLLAAVMTESVLSLQAERSPGSKKPAKITLPVDLRRLFDSKTLRNFALTVNTCIYGNQKLSFEEICREITRQVKYDVTKERMAARIAANVLPQRSLLLRIAPLFLKNLVMRFVYHMSGEKLGCLNISNLGASPMPENAGKHIQRLEFIVGVQKTYPNNCSVISCGDVTSINMIRNIKEADLEQKFFSRLVELGIPVTIEYNER